MLPELGKRINEHRIFTRNRKESEMKTSIAEIKKNKHILEGMNSRLSHTEECKSDVEDRIIIEITQLEQQKGKQI